MTGQELYTKLSKRDYSGSKEDLYAQFLTSCFFAIQEDLFPLLKKAQEEGKALDLDVQDLDEITVGSIILI